MARSIYPRKKIIYGAVIFLGCTLLSVRIHLAGGFDWEKLCKNCFCYNERFCHPEHFYFYYNVRNMLELSATPLQCTDLFMNTNNDSMCFSVDYMTHNPGILDIMGWAYIKKNSSFLSSTDIMLSSDEKSFFSSSYKHNRNDVMQLENDSNVLFSGFSALINLTTIPANYYRLGIVINTGDLHELKNSEHIIDIGNITDGLLQKTPAHEIAYAIDVWNENDEFFNITGWAFIKGYEQLPVTHLIVLYSTKGKHIFATNRIYRPDVSAAYNHTPSDSTGFYATFSRKKIPQGEYSTAIIITTDTLEKELLPLEYKVINILP